MESTKKTVEFNPEQIYTLAEAKALLKQNKGPLGGLRFYATNGREQTLAVCLPEVSSQGKIQATLKCLAGGPDHVREVSDWHQSLRSPEAKKASKAQVTDRK